MKKKILIPYASYGSGHKAIAKYIENYFKKQDSELIIETVDLLEFAMPVIGKWSQKINGYLMLKIPALHNLVYKIFDNRLSGLVADNISLTLFKNKAMTKYFQDFNPDLTIATHFFGSSLITYYNKKKITNSKLITVVTDYEAHELWCNDYQTDSYLIVGDKSEVSSLVKRGIAKEKIKPFGIPIAPQTKEKFNRNNTLKRYDLTGNKLICVFFGGGGNGSTASIPYIKKLIKNNLNLDIIFIAGRNEKSKSRVSDLANKYNANNIRILGYADNVPELLQLADFVITKPGGAQTTECLYYKKPILMINSSGGQEIANYKYFSKNNYGKRFRTSFGLLYFVKEIINNPRILKNMEKEMQKNHNDEAIKKLYDLCISLLKDDKSN